MIYGSEGIEEAFNKLAEETEKVKQIALRREQSLLDQLSFGKIQYSKSTILDKVVFDYRDRDIRVKFSTNYGDREANERIEEFTEWCRGISGITVDYSKNIRFRFDVNKQKEAREILNNVVKKLVEFDKKRYEENQEVSNNNAKLYSSLSKLFDEIGLPTSYLGYKTKRSRTTSRIEYGYRNEISGLINRTNWDNQFSRDARDAESKIDNLFNYKLKQVIEEHHEKLKQEEEKKKNLDELKLIARMNVKYKLGNVDDIGDMLYSLVGLDKNLELAYAMERVRNWGREYTDNVFRVYQSHSWDDNGLVKQMEELYERWHEGDIDDGRVFRDIKYGYDYLYGLVDEELLSDFELVRSKSCVDDY